MPERAAVVHWLDRQAGDLFERYQYRRIITPTFEDTALFTRSIGEASDIVRKEMYTFIDRGDRSLTLRPEATAPVVRAFIEHNLGAAGHLPVKLYYFANMFRYERPQAGRYREFWQLGAEAFGVDRPELDAEVILMAMEYLRSIGIGEATLKIGSMGDERCRGDYTAELRRVLSAQADSLCDDCRQRLALNPLRVFDCKNPDCQRSLSEAPKMLDHLCQECEAHFVAVGDWLRAVDLPFVIDPMLVRGFDYYTRTTFEITGPALGAQNALGGGGRYDRLVGDYGGKPTPAVGFAMGIERLMLGLGDEKVSGVSAGQRPDALLAVVDENDLKTAFQLAINLRREGLSVEVQYSARNLRKQMELADKLRASHAVVLGPDELARGQVKIRDLSTGEQTDVSLGQVGDWLKKH